MTRDCAICGLEYQAEARYVNRGQGLTCSKVCGTKLALKIKSSKKSAKIDNVQCSYCQESFWMKPSAISKTDFHYCSMEHRELGRKDGHFRSGPSAATKPYVACLYCSEPLLHSQTATLHKTCTTEYHKAAWLAGDNTASLRYSRTTGLPSETKAFVKQHLIEVRGDRCEVCLWEEKAPDGRSIIQMDHIDGDCFNNTPSNLKLLCPNHHAMTSTYGSLNKGSGRAHRRKKFSET